jgi:hypothetical protein
LLVCPEAVRGLTGEFICDAKNDPEWVWKNECTWDSFNGRRAAVFVLFKVDADALFRRVKEESSGRAVAATVFCFKLTKSAM